ncbi:MAG TPA: CDP-alcohol phosphatidyltransferase family protein [Vicinamibacterales bacterium]|nr:CDP-alcohol phosphatidyltransferase family protein [Vicinamibacterales bacterium]
MPPSIGSHHLTLLTLPWSGLVLGAGCLARHDPRWLFAVSALIVLQYLTDAVDGKVGKVRNAGLVRWGYYMDHLLDYVFLCAVLGVYAMLVPAESQYLMMLVLAVSGGFMVSAFLARAVTGELPISYGGIGPAEIRLVFIAINTWLVIAGRVYMLAVVPYVIVAATTALGTLVWRTQRQLWRLDEEAARRSTSASAPVAKRFLKTTSSPTTRSRSAFNGHVEPKHQDASTSSTNRSR